MNPIPPCIALLGGTGFIGRAVLRNIAAASNTHRETHVLQHKTALQHLPDWATIHNGSLSNIPLNFLPRTPHVVLHCANKHVDRDSTGFDVNLQGIEQLAALVNPHTQAILYVSSYSVYGDDTQRDIVETAPLRPQSALAKSRAACEQRLATLASTGRCRVIICRTRFVLGADDRFVLPGIVKLLRARITIGNGKQRYSVIAVDDFARILLKLGWQASMAPASFGPSEIFNVGYEQPISMDEINAALAQVLPIKKPLWHIPISHFLLRWMDRVPSAGVRQLVQRLRLIGCDHYGDVHKLQQQLGNDWLQANPYEVVRQIATSLSSKPDTL
jgi:nucleoside-diphosphate-sugar epimerase